MQKKIKTRTHARDYSEYLTANNPYEQILKDIFLSRDAEFGKQSNYTLANMHRPDALHSIDSAVQILFHALEKQQRILIVGDFDADGATSTALAVRCLTAFGAHHVDYLVPNRFVFGYGLTPEIVQEALKKQPDLIVTVDNGISSIAGVAAAKAAGVKVLVTDHHLPGLETPIADAIVNPNQHGCQFPSKNLAGVGVIFYVMSALRKYLRECQWFEKHNLPQPNMGAYLDIVALGTVADVVPLDYNNRILVAAGLKKMRAGNAIPGINALLKVASKEYARISSSDLGFALGPRLNAAGRLDDMSLGIHCLLTDSPYEALQIAQELDELNRDRKLIEASMQQEAMVIMQNFSAEDVKNQHGICLHKSDWHQGVIGILASRIKDNYHRPTIIFADDDNGGLKGSGRSIPGIHLRDVLDEIAAACPGLLEKFGGHAMAAGLSLETEKLKQFQHAFNRIVEKHLTEEIAEPIVLSDGELPEEFLQLNLAYCINDAGPWGQHFSAPVFHGQFNIVQQRIVGEKHLKLVLTRGEYSNQVFDAIAFNIDPNQWPNDKAQKVSIAYQLDVNEFRGETNLQLMVNYIEVSEG